MQLQTILHRKRLCMEARGRNREEQRTFPPSINSWTAARTTLCSGRNSFEMAARPTVNFRFMLSPNQSYVNFILPQYYADIAMGEMGVAGWRRRRGGGVGVNSGHRLSPCFGLRPMSLLPLDLSLALQFNVYFLFWE